MAQHIGSSPAPPKARRCVTGPPAWRARGCSARTRIQRSRCTRTRSPSTCNASTAAIGRVWGADARLRPEARDNRCEFLVCPTTPSTRRCRMWNRAPAALAAHRRGRGRSGRRARVPAPRADRYAVACRERDLSREARSPGVAYVRPNPVEREDINRIIMEELVYGVVTSEAVACFQRVISRMKAEGCDAVVLGCTEIR